MSGADIPDTVRRLISERIDSVPEVEAILLLSQHRGREWSAREVAKALYVGDPVAERLLSVLAERGFFVCQENRYRYSPATPELEAAVLALAHAYVHQLIPVTRLIHAKASPGVREFAQAFRLRKDK
jgi:hypothetical protein